MQKPEDTQALVSRNAAALVSTVQGRRMTRDEASNKEAQFAEIRKYHCALEGLGSYGKAYHE